MFFFQSFKYVNLKRKPGIYINYNKEPQAVFSHKKCTLYCEIL